MALKSPQARTYFARLTRAQVNAGVIAVPASPGRIYTVVDGWMRAIGGNAATHTSIDVTDDTDVVASLKSRG